MKIINLDTTVLSFSVIPDFFEHHNNEISVSFTGQSTWRRAENGSYNLSHNLMYTAKDSVSGDYFINYEGRLTLVCINLEIEQDCLQILELKEAFYESMKQFIMDNCFGFSYLLKFNKAPFSMRHVEREQETLSRLMQTKPFEEKKNSEKEFEKYFDNVNLKINIVEK